MEILPRDERQERWLYILLAAVITVVPPLFVRPAIAPWAGPLLGSLVGLGWAFVILRDMRAAIAEAEAEEKQALMEEENPVANKVNEFINYPARKMNEVLERLEALEQERGIKRVDEPGQPMSTLRKQGRP